MREVVQTEKALICKSLGDLVMRVPAGVCNGSIQVVNKWKEDRKKAASVLKSKTSSVPKLKEMMQIMEQYK